MHCYTDSFYMFSWYFSSSHTPQMNVNVVKAAVFHTNEQHKLLRNIWFVAKLISNSVLLNYILSHYENSFNVTESAHCMVPEGRPHFCHTLSNTGPPIGIMTAMVWWCKAFYMYRGSFSVPSFSNVSGKERTCSNNNFCIPVWCSQQLWGKASNTTYKLWIMKSP